MAWYWIVLIAIGSAALGGAVVGYILLSRFAKGMGQAFGYR